MAGGASGHHGRTGDGDLVQLRSWLDVDALSARNPHALVALLVALGFGVYLLQSAFINSFLRPCAWRGPSSSPVSAGGARVGSVLEAEEIRVVEKSLRIFLHRCFLVACIVASVGPLSTHVQYPFFKEWVLYLWGAAVCFLLRRTLLLSETALEHVTAVMPRSSSSGGGGRGKGKGSGHASRPSIWTVLLWLAGNLAAVMAFIHRQRLASMYPLVIYDALGLGCEAGSVFLKYAALSREEDEEDEGTEDSTGNGGSNFRRRRPASMGQRVRAWFAGWGWDAATVHQHVGFGLGFTAASVSVVQHLHVWVLKGFGSEQGGGGLSDFLFFFLLQRCLWRCLHVARSFLIILSYERLISRLFPTAAASELRRDAADVCSICLKPLNKPHSNVKRLPCNHLLHASCLLQCLVHGAGAGGGFGGGRGPGGGPVGMGDGAAPGRGGIGYVSTAKCPLCRRGLLGTGREGDRQVGSARDAQVAAAAAPPVEATAPVAAAAAAVAEQVRPIPEAGEQQEEQALLRFSTEDILPSWLPLPVPSFSLEVVRRRPARRRVGGENEEDDEIVQIPPQQQ